MIFRFLTFILFISTIGGIFFLFVVPMIKKILANMEHKLSTKDRVLDDRQRRMNDVVGRAIRKDGLQKLGRKPTNEELKKILNGDTSFFD